MLGVKNKPIMLEYLHAEYLYAESLHAKYLYAESL